MALHKITLVLEDDDDYDGMMESLIALGGEDIADEPYTPKPDGHVRPPKPTAQERAANEDRQRDGGA